MASRSIVCVFNPRAGEGRFGVRPGQLRDLIMEQARSSGVDVDLSIRITKRQDHGERIADRARKRGVDVVVAVGGDGTISEVANAIAGSDTALGVIPVGSGNDTLVSMEVPLDRGSCIRDIIDNRPRMMDIGKMNDRYFVNGVGIGLDARVNHESANHRKLVKSIGPTGVYALSALKVLMGYRPIRLILTPDGKRSFTRDVSLCTIGNGTVAGGGFRLTPRAKMDDGRLDLSVASWTGRLDSVLKMKRVHDGRHLGMSIVTYMRFRRLTIEGDGRPIPYHIDGEGGYAKGFDIRVVPDGINVMHRVHGR